MHPNPVFHMATDAENLKFALQRGFGTLALNDANGPLISHVPFVLSKDGLRIEAHLVRSNPIIRALKSGPQKVVLAIIGPDSYVSPDWYEVEDQVPTWNYVAVHIRGVMRLREQSELRGHLDHLANEFETRLLPKPIWKTDKVNTDALVKLMRMIVPVEMEIAQIDGTWKLGQNKGDAPRLSAAKAVDKDGFGSETAAIAALMRNPDRA